MPTNLSRRGISTFIAVILLLALAISSGTVIYAYTMGYLGILGGDGSGKGFSRMSLDSSALTDEGLKAYVRNVGSGTIKLDKAYVDSTPVQGSGYTFEVNDPGSEDDEIAEGEIGIVTLNIPGGFEAGKSYEFKLIAAGGVQLVFSVRSSGVVSQPSQPGWLTGWGKRVGIAIDHDDVDSDLTDFAVLLHLSSSSGRDGDDVTFIFDELQTGANRMKIAITTEDSSEQCYVEIDDWDQGNEEAWLWVKVPSINSTEDTTLYLYYDRSQPDNTAYVGDSDSSSAEMVWDDSFIFVSHMKDDPDDSHIRDSTSENNDGSKFASGEPSETTDGQIDAAQDFDGANDYVERTPFTYDFTEITATFWMKTSDSSKSGTPVSCSSGSQHNEFLIYNYRDFAIYIKGSTPGSTGVSANDGSWHHIVVTWRSSDGRVRLFKEGAEGYSGTRSAGATINLANILIGQEQDAFGGSFDPSQAFLGNIDEVRISKTVRSDAWIKVDYESGRDHLVAFGSEETA